MSALLEVSVEPKSEGCDPKVFLGQPGSTESATYDVAKDGEPEVLPVVSLTDTALELGVRGERCAGTEYAIRFKRRLSGGALEAEPNDALSAAWPMSAPGELQGFYDRPQDRDVLRVALPGVEGAVYTLRLSGMERITQTLEVFTSPQATAHEFALFAPPGQGVELPNVKLGDKVQELWIAIGATESKFSREEAWRLQWVEHPPTPAHLQLEVEPNDAAHQAQPIELERPVTGYLHHAADVDRFALELAPPVDALEPAPSPGPDMDMGAQGTPPESSPSTNLEGIEL
ncbi:MAG: hypothetical protein AAGI01_14080, partial [Myxococcota bacterium]